MLALLTGALPHTARGQTRRPLVTEDVDTLEDGHLEVQLAVELVQDFASPTRPFSGSLLRAPVVGLNFGVGNRAELQLRAPLRQRFAPDGFDVRSATGDVTLATKLRLFGGRGLWPGVGFRALVKLPNISESTGIATDETDVTLELLGGIDIGGASLAASLGLAILGDPRTLASQNDKLTYGVGVLLPLGLFDIAGDLHGAAFGDDGASDVWSALLGGASSVGPLRFDAAVGVLSQGSQQTTQIRAGVSFEFGLLP